MSFLNTIWLAALGLLAVPLVLHLIYRQRYPERRFSTLRFFTPTVKHNVIQRRLIDKLLLLLRLLALLALVLALARPFWKVAFGEKRLTVVLIVDNSPSMGRLVAGQAAFDKARLAAGKVLAELSPTDRAALLLTAPGTQSGFTTDRAALRRAIEARAGQPCGFLVQGETGRAVSWPGMSTDTAALLDALQKVPAATPVAVCGYAPPTQDCLTTDIGGLTRQLAEARLAESRGDPRTTLLTAARLLRASQDGDRKIMIFSDLAPNAWDFESAPEFRGLHIVVARLEPAVSEQDTNLSVDDCRTEEREAGLGQTVLATATVRNWGARPVPQAKLEVTAGERGRTVELPLPPIPPVTAIRVSFPLHVLSRARSLLCRIRVACPGDTFPYDDTRWFQIGVVPPVPVLCVNGVPAANPAGREAFFVMNALGLPGTGNRSANPLEVQECEMDALAGQALFKYRVIVLVGVDRLDDEARRRLRQFVEDGGGLLVFPGPHAALEEYNAWGFLPARLAERKTGQFNYVRAFSRQAPDMAALAERIGGGGGALTCRDWFLLAPGKETEVLASFADGAPALVRQPLGRGQVVLAAVNGHTTGSDWPLRPAFPLLLRALTESLGAPRQPLPLLPLRDTGESLVRMIPPELAAGTPAVFRLDEVKEGVHYVPLPWFRDGAALTLPAATQPGHYLLTVAPGSWTGLAAEPALGASLVAFSANPVTGEGALATLSPARLVRPLAGAKVTEKVLGGNPAVLVDGLRSGRELWRVLLIGALVFLVVESLLGWRYPSQAGR